MANSLLCAFGQQGLQSGLGFIVLQMGRLGPGNDDAEKARGFAAFDTAPEFAVGADDEVLVERIGTGGDAICRR
jgi:hypothetical protein